MGPGCGGGLSELQAPSQIVMRYRLNGHELLKRNRQEIAFGQKARVKRLCLKSKREVSQNVTLLSGIPLIGFCDVIACVIRLL